MQAPFDRFWVLSQIKYGHDDHPRGLRNVEDTVRVLGHQQFSINSPMRTTDSGVTAQQGTAPIGGLNVSLSTREEYDLDHGLPRRTLSLTTCQEELWEGSFR